MHSDPKILEKRLRDVLALDGQFSKEAARDAIEREKINGAVCARIPAVGGRVANFQKYFETVFGEKL